MAPCLERKDRFEPLGEPCLRGAFRLDRIWDLSSRSYNARATTGRVEGVGCGLGLKYALNVAAVVSEEKLFHNSTESSSLY